MSTKSEALKKRMIRRHELRQIVPLADTTIYEMEQRGEFPGRFALTPQCVVWDRRIGPSASSPDTVTHDARANRCSAIDPDR